VTPPAVLRLFFDHGAGGCLWAGDAATRDHFGYGPLDAGVCDPKGRMMTPPALPLSPTTRALRDALLVDHLTALDPDDPGGPSPWSEDQRQSFAARVAQFSDLLQAELGPGFLIVNEQDRV
jgi:hypothetical protein